MNCPICNHPDLSEGALSCPQCNSDLESYTYITGLDTQVKKQKQTIWILSGVLALSIVVSIYSFSKNKNEAAPMQNTNEMMKLKNENAQLQSTINNLKKQMEEKQTQTQTAAPATTASSSNYIVKKGESLWTIAQKELGDGNKYSQLAKDNNIQNPNMLTVGMELKIIK